VNSFGNPLISVLLSVYNGERFIEQSIKSILAQTFLNFEFIIVNDGSTDNTLKVINKYKLIDKRIRVVNQENQGLTASLVTGVKIAGGVYIARQDVDDVSLPNRFEKQYKAMEKYGADVCFSSVKIINDGLTTVYYNPHLSSIKWNSLFSNKYGFHSAVMFKKDSIIKIGGYDQNFKFAQDYDLWDRCMSNGLKFNYLNEVLVQFSINREQLSSKYLDKQNQYRDLISSRALRRAVPTFVGDTLVNSFIKVYNCKYSSVNNRENTKNIFKYCYVSLVILIKSPDYIYRASYYLIRNLMRFAIKCYKIY